MMELSSEAGKDSYDVDGVCGSKGERLVNCERT